MDVLDELVQEHATVRATLDRFERDEIGPDDPLIDEVVRALSVHAATEELVVYPAFDAAFSPSEAMVEQHLKEHQIVKDLLADIERSHGDDRRTLLASLAVFVRAHVEHEEGAMFPRLREHATNEQLEDVRRALERARKVAPTHPHPHAPRTQPGVTLAGAAAGALDKVRDLVTGRR